MSVLTNGFFTSPNLITSNLNIVSVNDVITNGNFSQPSISNGVYIYWNSLTQSQKNLFFWTPESTSTYVSLQRGITVFNYPNPIGISTQYCSIQFDSSMQQLVSLTKRGYYQLSYYYVARPGYAINPLKFVLNSTIALDSIPTTSVSSWTNRNKIYYNYDTSANLNVPLLIQAEGLGNDKNTAITNVALTEVYGSGSNSEFNNVSYYWDISGTVYLVSNKNPNYDFPDLYELGTRQFSIISNQSSISQSITLTSNGYHTIQFYYASRTGYNFNNLEIYYGNNLTDTITTCTTGVWNLYQKNVLISNPNEILDFKLRGITSNAEIGLAEIQFIDIFIQPSPPEPIGNLLTSIEPPNKFVRTYINGFLDISGSLELNQGGMNIIGGDISMNGDLYLTNKSVLKLQNNTNVSYFQGGTNFLTGSTSDIVFTGINKTPEFMRIKATTGYIGINKSNPQYYLDVNGSSIFSSAPIMKGGNIYSGNENDGYNNIGIGMYSMYGIEKLSSYNVNNTSFGNYSRYNAFGRDNTSMGVFSMFNASGDFNSAFGMGSSYGTNGSFNTAMGCLALCNSNLLNSYYYNVPGEENTNVSPFFFYFYNKYRLNNSYTATVNTANFYETRANVAKKLYTYYINTAGEKILNTSDEGTSMNLSVISANLKNSNTIISSYNSALGYQCLYNNSGSYNSAMGYQCMFLNNGSYNSAIGNQTMYNNKNGDNNTVVGNYSLYNNSGGSFNTILGHYCLSNNNVGYYNTVVGYKALQNSVSGSKNTVIGNYVLNLAQQASENNIINMIDYPPISSYAGSNISGVCAMGYNSIVNPMTSNNCAFGSYALSTLNNGIFNCAFGPYSLFSNVSGSYNCAFGANSLKNNVMNANTAFGGNTLSKSYMDTSNCAFGYSSMYNINGGSCNSAIGAYSLYGENQDTTYYYMNNKGTSNVYYCCAIGSYSLYNNNSGNFNNAVGSYSLYSNIFGNHNCVVGTNSMYNNINGNYNCAFGSLTLYSDISYANCNNCFGAYSLYYNLTGSYNNAFGYYSAYNNTYGNYNNSFGSYSLYNNTTGQNNVAIGNYALPNNLSGSNNVAIGDYAGINNYAQSNNTFIGNYTMIDVSTNHWVNSVAIGRNAKITGSNLVALGGPNGNVHIPGFLNVAGTFYSGGTFFTSDYKIKKNIKEIKNTKIDEIRVVKYTHRQTNKEEIGVIAHELSEIHPMLVNGNKNESNIQKVNYIGLIGLVTSELKKCKKELLENKNELLKIKENVEMLKCNEHKKV